MTDAAQAFLLLSLLLYLVPGIVAIVRSHQHAGAIFVLDLLLGWTLLGWIIALVWACMNQRETPASWSAPRRAA
jgi:hypothetical protein